MIGGNNAIFLVALDFTFELLTAFVIFLVFSQLVFSSNIKLEQLVAQLIPSLECRDGLDEAEE